MCSCKISLLIIPSNVTLVQRAQPKQNVNDCGVHLLSCPEHHVTARRSFLSWPTRRLAGGVELADDTESMCDMQLPSIGLLFRWDLKVGWEQYVVPILLQRSRGRITG